MSGVGSTNAMKKGSANNPFLAYSKEDMQGYLKSAYTGCIVKYAGPSTKTAVPRGNNLNLGDAQNLVVDLTKSFTDNQGLSKSRKWYITIESETGNKCIMDITIDKQTGVIGTPTLISDTIKALIYSIYTPYSSLIGRNINDLDVKFLSVTGTDVDRDVVTNWPTTSGWQKDCFNDSGKITLWGYGEKVTAIQNQNDMDYWSAYAILYTEPYVANVLYKVVYSNGQYYFEEFYHISENVTTATVEDVAPGKTFYDFTGTKQTGTGTKINPYIASTADEMAAYLTSSYKGAFVKYIGKTVAVGGTPIPFSGGETSFSDATGVYINKNLDALAIKNAMAEVGSSDISAGFWTDSESITLYVMNSNGVLVMLISETLTPIYAETAIEIEGVQFVGGFENISENGDIAGFAPTQSYIDDNKPQIFELFVSKTPFSSDGGESYVKNAIYQVAEDGDTTRYAILPTLSNPADPIDVAEGKEVINQLGAVMIGTGNVVLRAATTEGMQALFTTENIGKVVQYVGETDVYIKDAIYQVVDISEFKQYYELPSLTNEGASADLAQGKELINSKGEKVTGTFVPPQIKEGEITPTENVDYIYISGVTARPKATSVRALNDTNTLKARYIFDYPGNEEDRIGCMYFRGGSYNNYNFTNMVINIENGSLKIGGGGYDFRAGVTYKYRLVL